MTLEATIREQQKIIEYLAGQYEQETGRRPLLPSQIGELLGDKSILSNRDNL